MLMNTGGTPVNSYNGLLTTVGYQIGDKPPVYALEGSIAVTGSLVQWMRDQMGLIKSAAEIETLASSVEDNGGAYFVPAFSGLFAPYWRPDARGVIAGLTRYVTKAHIARAVLEATAWQTREISDAMTKDSGVELTALKVDGGMTSNNLLMQTLSDFLDAPVVRPMVAETTCLGAAYAAGLTHRPPPTGTANGGGLRTETAPVRRVREPPFAAPARARAPLSPVRAGVRTGATLPPYARNTARGQWSS
ncbi:glycerol kinase GlpK [Streptomyces californicus]